MFRSFFVLLLINTGYRSFGNPVPANINSTNLSISMTALATRCKNEFLSNQIKSKIKDCSLIIPPNGAKVQLSSHHLQCLIFYDINKQLCSAVDAEKLYLNGDYTGKLHEEQDVNTLCNIAKDWSFATLSEYPHYQPDKVFKHLVTCGKICGVEDVISDNANYYCKYFNWGMEMLKSHASTPQVSVNTNGVASLLDSGNINTSGGSALNSNSSSTVQISTANTNATIHNDLLLNKPSVKVEPLGKNNIKPDIELQETSSHQQLLDKTKAVVPEKPDDLDVNASKIEGPAALPENDISSNGQSNKVVADETPQKQDVDKNGQQSEDGKDFTQSKIGNDAQSFQVDKDAPLFNSGTDPLDNKIEHKETVIEHPEVKPQGETDDYQGDDLDGDEGKEGLIDTQGGDDGDDPMLGDVDIKLEQEQNKNSEKKTEPAVPSFNGDLSLKEYYPNTIPEEDDDHFFSFFLTAVVLIILLYVLYHNKSKVSKVILGLMLEGRQPGRRRNSRGHAYRRLDTLEQAMSANTAAPPSKIIY